MQKLSGRGMAFLEFDGHVVEDELQPGQQIVVDTGDLAAMDATCSMEIQIVQEIDRRFVNEVRAKYPGNEEKVRNPYGSCTR